MKKRDAYRRIILFVLREIEAHKLEMIDNLDRQKELLDLQKKAVEDRTGNIKEEVLEELKRLEKEEQKQ